MFIPNSKNTNNYCILQVFRRHIHTIWQKGNKYLKKLNNFNSIHPSINFTIEMEKHKRINYSYITVYYRKKQLEFSIYRKHTQTDIIIPNSLCHPNKHKLSSIKCLLKRLNTYPITKKVKQIEINTIRNTLQNKEYSKSLLEKPLPQSHKQNIHKDQIRQKTKWATFT
jgi:hypothetical protein